MKDYSLSHTNTNGSGFPNTAAVNASAPSATDGTEYVKLTIDDIWGFNQALMREAGLTPDGNDETATASQRVEAIRFLIQNKAFNAYFNGTNWIAIAGTGLATDVAYRWWMDDSTGRLKFQYASSVTAGASISFNDGPYIDQNGFVGSITEPFLHIQDQKTSGTDGGTFTSGSYQTRTLNTVVTNTITGASLSTNQITLPAGTYYIESLAPAYRVGAHKAKLYNVTDAADEIIGKSSSAGTTDVTTVDSVITGEFTIASSKAFEIRHRCASTEATDGFGRGTTFGDIEVYTDVRIWKIG